MNKISFNEILEKFSENYYIGLGNPNSKILFIGKESGTDVGTTLYHGTVNSWKKNPQDYFKKFIPEDSNLLNLNHTWQRYQKLYELILQKLNIEFEKSNKYEISFVENIFTTELNHLPAKTTTEAKKQNNFEYELQKRKREFIKSDFIKNFQVVIIFANDNKYIETYPGEVCDLFEVNFDSVHDYEGKDKIWVHYENDNYQNKLLLHTRQLTISIGSDLY